MLKTFHILIVDDDPVVAQTLMIALNEERGYSCESVSSVRAAIARCQTNGTDAVELIILDKRLNHYDDEADNLEGFLQIRQRFPRIPIILHTGFPDETEKIRAFQRGAQGYLSKPIINIQHDLFDVIAMAVARQQNVNRLLDEIDALEARIKSVENKMAATVWKDRRFVLGIITALLTALAAVIAAIVSK